MWNDLILILDGTLRISVPFVLAAMGGIFAERSGVIDFGLEGKMLGGAFVAATVAHWSQSAWMGLLGSICIGIIFAYISNNSEYFPSFEILITSTCLAFLYWNWKPAKIFLGDVGSIVLGFVCILSLYWLFLDGNTWHWVLCLPMYYVLDTTLTLINRLISGKKIWQAHSEHFYQKAVQSGMSHSYVVKLIIGLQIIIILTCYFVKNPYLVVFLSFLESMGLIIYFSSKYKKST